MVIIGSPKDPTEYYLADEEIAFALHQRGFMPIYKDFDAIYFKKNKKLLKALKELDIEIA